MSNKYIFTLVVEEVVAKYRMDVGHKVAMVVTDVAWYACNLLHKPLQPRRRLDQPRNLWND